ncbi:MAG TPA: ATP-binding cassette domain-containing protein [Dehalococcoidia bacterium]|nr:ATP-binding cassette domain-containing protein [Dehalococcoidia bacterium]
MTAEDPRLDREPDDSFAIQTFGLRKQFGELVAVDSINLDIKKGELFAFLGPNGAGKTTTISMLCCLLKPTGGTARIMGYDINREPYRVKEVIGVSPQDTTLSEHLSSRENLNLVGRLHGIDPKKLKTWSQLMLQTMGLADRAKEQVRRFSGGMKRRLNIAMALIHNPDIIFLDEPTLGLDPQARRAVWSYIARLKGEKTILLTTHYMEEADFLADRIGIIDEGKIVALGTALDLKTGMIDTHTMVVQAWNLTQKLIIEMRERYAKIDISNGTMTITDKKIDFREIVDRLHDANVSIRSAYIKEPTLEDVFINITGKELRE